MNDDKLQQFLYLLMRDHLPTGQVELVMNGLRDTRGMKAIYSAPELANYAAILASEIRELSA